MRVLTTSRRPAGWLVRNCPIGHFTCLEIDERKTQIPGTLTQTTEDVRPMLRVGGFGTRIAIDQCVLQGAIDQDRQFTCSGRDGLGFADAERGRR